LPPLDLFPGAGLRLGDLVLTPTTAVVLLAATAPTAVCPQCGTASDRVHSRYRRTVADLPSQGRVVALRLLVRKFRCARPDCPRRIFCERLPQVLPAHARSTTRLAEAHRDIGFALGGEAGGRLAGLLHMPTSPHTLLRRVKAGSGEPAPPPRCVGIDDWAIRKGQRYGTIVIDLERRRVLDLLPGRDGQALKAWLREHPGVELVTRDRWAAFAQAAAEAAPQARQVADRFHLLRNLREAVERLLGRMSAAVREALCEPPPEARAVPPESSARSDDACPEAARGGEADAGAGRPSLREQARQEKRRRRAERYGRVRELRRQGLSVRRIAREVGLHVNAVRRYLQEERCPDWNPGRRPPTQLDAFAALMDDWIGRGGRNAAELHRDLAARGCRASYDAVRRCVARRLGSAGRPGRRTGPLKPAAPPAPSPRQLSFDFIRRPEGRDEDKQRRLDRLRAGDAALREGLDLAAEFAALVRKAGNTSFAEWLAAVEGSGCGELRSFAAGLRQDEAAVVGALTEAWSNGPVEGQVNRLKTIKRQMYGRAGFELLRARVLRAA
jgi:transposase